MSNVIDFQAFVAARAQRENAQPIAVGQSFSFTQREEPSDFGLTHNEPVQAQTPTRQPRVAANKGTVCAAEPLMSYSDVRAVMDAILAAGRTKEYACFCIGLSTGLRVSDIVALRWGDMFTMTHGVEDFAYTSNFQYERMLPYHQFTRLTFKDSLDIIEQKTKKRTVSNVDEMLVTEATKMGVCAYIEKLGAVQDGDGWLIKSFIDENDFLFPATRNGGSIVESTVYRAITNAVKAAGIDCHAGTHTMRKTFLNIANTMGCTGSFASNATALTDCQILARHSNIATTLRYMNATKHRVMSLRRAVSDFLMGRTKVKSLQAEYEWELE